MGSIESAHKKKLDRSKNGNVREVTSYGEPLRQCQIKVLDNLGPPSVRTDFVEISTPTASEAKRPNQKVLRNLRGSPTGDHHQYSCGSKSLKLSSERHLETTVREKILDKV